MENDPNKKDTNKNESKAKRLFKKATRRNSKSSQNSSNGVVGVSDSDGSKEIETAVKCKQDEKIALPSQKASPNIEAKVGKSVDIQENRNKIFGVSPSPSKKSSKLIYSPQLVIKDQITEDGVKRNLKRKLDEENGAGTSGTSTGTDTDADDKDPTKAKKKKNRCAVCGKKVGLTGFECRCGGLFCAVHRYSDKHDCSFDYKELGAQEIRRNNPVVVSQKIDKI